MPANEETIMAHVVLFYSKGNSLLDEQQITSGNIQELGPNEKSIRTATIELQQVGFTCHALYPTLSISGPRSLFEKTFHLHFETKMHNASSYVQPVKKAIIPESLKNIVADIVFSEPVEPFA